MGTEFPWRWGRGTISANLDVIWGTLGLKSGRSSVSKLPVAASACGRSANKFVEQHHADADISCRVNARQAVARLVVVSWGHGG